MLEDRKKFMSKKGSKEIEILGFDPDKVQEEAYHSQQVEPSPKMVI